MEETFPPSQIAVFVFGVSFVSTLLVLAINFPRPTDFQYLVFRIVLAISVAGIAANMPGLLDVSVSSIVSASGALGVFVVVYFFSPANIVVQSTSSSIVETLNDYWETISFPQDPLEGMEIAKAYNAITKTSYLWMNASKEDKAIIHKEIWETAFRPWFDALERSDLRATDGKRFTEHLVQHKPIYLEMEKWTH